MIPGSPPPDWEATALAAIDRLAASGRRFVCADLDVPAPPHAAHWGSVMAKAKALRIVRRVGYTASPRPSRSGGVCAVWERA